MDGKMELIWMTTKEEAMQAVEKLLSYLEKDSQREGLKKTPQRVIESWDEIFSGYYDHHLLYLNEVKKKKETYKISTKNWKKIVLPIVRNPLLKNNLLYIKNPKFRKHIYQFEEFKKSIFCKNLKDNFYEKNYCKSLMKNRMVNEMLNEIVPVVLKEDDLNGMYHSIENRSPFLDSNLFKSGLNMPSEFYIKDGLAKWPLRQIIKGIVPDKIRLNERKTGFNASIKDIFNFNKENIEYLTKDNEIFNIINKDRFKDFIKKNKYFSGVQNNFMFNFLSVKLFLESVE